jgi:hypothetical protein
LWAIKTFAESKVCYFNHTVAQNKIVWFEITMHNIYFSKAFEGFYDLFEVIDSFSLEHYLVGVLR